MCRFGIAAWCLGVEQKLVIRTAAMSGFEVIHLGFGRMENGWINWTGKDIQDLSEDAARYGVKIEALALNVLEIIGCAHPRESAAGKRCREIAQMAVDSAGKLESDFIYVPCFGNNEIKSMDDVHRHAEFLYELCQSVNGSGLAIATENTLDGVRNTELISKVAHPRVRVLFDLYNPVLHGIDSRTLLESVGPYMCDSIHVKDGVAGVCGNVPIGEGDGKVRECAHFLMSSGFRGSVVLENNYFHEPERRTAFDLLTARSLFV